MSYYFVHLFSGRYPNAPDYQLLNYGAGRSMDGSYRDPGNMHAGSYGGYKYNGMDLSISGSATTTSSSSSSQFGAVGESSRVFSAQAALESRLREAFSCSLSCPESLPCTSSTSSGGVNESHGGKTAGSPRQPVASVGAVSVTAFAEIDENSASSRTESGSQANNGARVQTEPNATSTLAA
ncbi:LOW QUALITY PROTEIN: homeobox protein Hox-B5-like [Thamnophis elegans]|uniref:LOW QUALITY PROTEIN: homeobox protein Hox-B5-like n=1 Tax=Thamnophis elegans TaxID=35005 RepID=UPI0013777472|nr:LOW QUALITY PROTEIN: homeobox protein Hox-B5-like [Thamnophis elegans]